MTVTQPLDGRQWIGGKIYCNLVSTCTNTMPYSLKPYPTVLWPSNIHEAENTADRDIGVRQTALDQAAVLALLDPRSQGAKTAVDFAHLAL